MIWYMLRFLPVEKLANRVLVLDGKKVLFSILIHTSLNQKLIIQFSFITNRLILGSKVFVSHIVSNIAGVLQIFSGRQERNRSLISTMNMMKLT